MNKLICTLLVAGAGLSASIAVSAADMATSTSANQDASATAMTDGIVKKVEMETNEITIKHGPIKNVGMAGMTMAYPVADPMLLNGIKEGDKIRFSAEKISGSVTVTKIDSVK